jgi:hypothetical protein
MRWQVQLVIDCDLNTRQENNPIPTIHEITLHHEYMRGYIQTNILP